MNELDVLVAFKWVMDGSEGHLQLGPNADSQIISIWFVVTKIFFMNDTVLWTLSELLGTSSPRNICPWSLITAQESREVLEVLTPQFERNVFIMHTNGLVLHLPSGLRVRVRFAEIKFSMIDRKLI